MQVERYPFNWDAHQRFPEIQEVARFDGGVVYSAEAADRFYLVVDESALNDKLTPGTEYILNSLIGVHEFTTAAERTAYVASRGWTSSDS